MSEVFRYVIARKEGGSIFTYMIMNREILLGDLEDACNDLAYVKQVSGRNDWEILTVNLRSMIVGG